MFASAYLFDLLCFLLRAGVWIELEGRRAGRFRLVQYRLLSLLGGDGAAGITRRLKRALLLELRGPTGGAFEHTGGRY